VYGYIWAGNCIYMYVHISVCIYIGDEEYMYIYVCVYTYIGDEEERLVPTMYIYIQ
jgi:hypothetical protein